MYYLWNPSMFLKYGINLWKYIGDTERKKSRNTLQVWYADDSDLASSYSRIKAWFVELIRIGPSLRYHPDLEKSLLVTSEANLNLATTFFSEEGFKIKIGLRYLGGYIGADKDAQVYLKDKVDSWVQSVKLFSKVDEKEPHAAFLGITHSLQRE